MQNNISTWLESYATPSAILELLDDSMVKGIAGLGPNATSTKAIAETPGYQKLQEVCAKLTQQGRNITCNIVPQQRLFSEKPTGKFMVQLREEEPNNQEAQNLHQAAA